MENLKREKLDNPLSYQRKSLSLYHANNLNISIMKAIVLLRHVVCGDFNIEQCGVASSDSIIVQGWQSYFGARWMYGSIKPREEYFYAYMDFEDDVFDMPCPDVYLEQNEAKGKILLWKIEN